VGDLNSEGNPFHYDQVGKSVAIGHVIEHTAAFGDGTFFVLAIRDRSAVDILTGYLMVRDEA
jgi:hypothetical protein